MAALYPMTGDLAPPTPKPRPSSTTPASAPGAAPATPAPASPLMADLGLGAYQQAAADLAATPSPQLQTTPYTPPNKTGQIIAGIVSLLFPGAPIAQAAAGFMKGAQGQAQQNYENANKEDQAKYAAAEQAYTDKAKTADTALTAYDAQARAQEVSDYHQSLIEDAHARIQQAATNENDRRTASIARIQQGAERLEQTAFRNHLSLLNFNRLVRKDQDSIALALTKDAMTEQMADRRLTQVAQIAAFLEQGRNNRYAGNREVRIALGQATLLNSQTSAAIKAELASADTPEQQQTKIQGYLDKFDTTYGQLMTPISASHPEFGQQSDAFEGVVEGDEELEEPPESPTALYQGYGGTEAGAPVPGYYGQPQPGLYGQPQQGLYGQPQPGGEPVQMPQPGTGVWMPMATSYAQQFAVDPSLIGRMIGVESHGDPMAHSPSGALGLMQLKNDTWKQMGITNPYDPQQNIYAGTKYIAQLLAKYNGNQVTALAAYNWGASNVDAVHGDFRKFPPDVQQYVLQVLGGGGPSPQPPGPQAPNTGANTPPNPNAAHTPPKAPQAPNAAAQQGQEKDFQAALAEAVQRVKADPSKFNDAEKGINKLAATGQMTPAQKDTALKALQAARGLADAAVPYYTQLKAQNPAMPDKTAIAIANERAKGQGSPNPPIPIKLGPTPTAPPPATEAAALRGETPDEVKQQAPPGTVGPPPPKPDPLAGWQQPVPVGGGAPLAPAYNAAPALSSGATGPGGVTVRGAPQTPSSAYADRVLRTVLAMPAAARERYIARQPPKLKAYLIQKLRAIGQ
jgi:hypothetical protein